jgi:phenylalanine-4-hydroxylase
MRFVPNHLRRFLVEQRYERYTPEDQAVWRYLMRQLKSSLASRAHEAYREGFEKTGLQTEKIPRIEDIDRHLQAFGWRAVPVSGFIPPAAFMEFQSLAILPIACDMRTVDHVLYTPAPDIVHEAAGHAPMLVHKEYNAYLRSYASVSRKAIFSREDLEQYEAIRELSDIKESPQSTSEHIRGAEQKLTQVNARLSFVSEAGWLSRLNWWTTEYGLVGPLKSPKIFGAGLLSSLGESHECLRPQVTKIPLSIDCLDYAYDITEPQPQLFVVEKFENLHHVLKLLEEKMAFRRGGIEGLETALKAQTLNTVELNSGLQISGCLTTIREKERQPFYLQFQGPCQLAFQDHELPGHSITTHASGFGTPVGRLKNHSRCLSQTSVDDLAALGIQLQKLCRLEFASGVVVEGLFSELLTRQGAHLVMSFDQCTVRYESQILFDPSWGRFDMAVGQAVTSVFGGSADREAYPVTEDFAASQVPEKIYTPQQKMRHQFYAKIRRLREQKSTAFTDQVRDGFAEYMNEWADQWLLGVELLELLTQTNLRSETDAALKHLHSAADKASSSLQFCIDQGIRLAAHGV